MALEVFHHHVPSGFVFDPNKSGAEWWVQIRPSPPKIGRYAMLDDNPDEISKTGISFHWDKDEDLPLLTGASIFVFPHISTVTYLTDYGAPTMVLGCRADNLTGEWIVPGCRNAKDRPEDETPMEGFVSWPRAGKHLSFDGRYLHAAPPDLMEEGRFVEQTRLPELQTTITTENDETKEQDGTLKLFRRRHRRVTFLVNVWLNYKPIDARMFPETMLDKMTKDDPKKGDHHPSCPMFPPRDAQTPQTNDRLPPERDIVVPTDEALDAPTKIQEFSWPMGCSSERVKVRLPLDQIRSVADDGGNVRIVWKRTDDKGCNGSDRETNVQTIKPVVVLVRGTETKDKDTDTTAAKDAVSVPTAKRSSDSNGPDTTKRPKSS